MPEISRPNQPRRILLWHWGRRGGGARYTFELAKELRDAGGVDVHLSLSRQCEIFADLESLGLPGHHVDTYSDIRSALFASLRLPFIAHSFWRYVRTQRIDTVVCTMSHLWNVPVLLGRPRHIPYILVLHDVVPHAGDDKPVRKFLLDREIAMSRGLITLTRYTQDLVRDLNHYPTDRIRVVPHGVFPYSTAAAASQRPEGPVRILFFGRLLPYKGLDILLDAYRAMKAKSSPISLSIVGPGDIAPYRAAIANLSDITVDNRWIPEDEIGSIFENADIVVAPYREASQSGVIATAYSAGVPVVVTPVGGLVEQVEDGVSGLVATAPTADALAQTLERLVSDDDLRARCGQGARHMADETLAWRSIAQRFAKAIDELSRSAS